MDTETLFSLIKRRTRERKINWDISSPSKLKGAISGTDFRLALGHGSDQRDGDWYTLTVTVGSRTIGVDDDEVDTLYAEIMGQSDEDTEEEAREILLSL